MKNSFVNVHDVPSVHGNLSKTFIRVKLFMGWPYIQAVVLLCSKTDQSKRWEIHGQYAEGTIPSYTLDMNVCLHGFITFIFPQFCPVCLVWMWVFNYIFLDIRVSLVRIKTVHKYQCQISLFKPLMFSC